MAVRAAETPPSHRLRITLSWDKGKKSAPLLPYLLVRNEADHDDGEHQQHEADNCKKAHAPDETAKAEAEELPKGEQEQRNHQEILNGGDGTDIMGCDEGKT